MSQEPMSLRAYARYRKASGLTGGNLSAVQKAIEAERISTVFVDGQRRIADPGVADREWAANTPPRGEDIDADGGERDGDVDSPARREKHWKANTAELTFRQRAGELVKAADVKAKFSEKFSTVRSRVLGVPSRARQRLPHLSHADLAVLDELLREALEELAGVDA